MTAPNDNTLPTSSDSRDTSALLGGIHPNHQKAWYETRGAKNHGAENEAP